MLPRYRVIRGAVMKPSARGMALLLVAVGVVVLASPPGGPQGAQGPIAVPGQSATLLPDGRWLLVGGEGAAGPVGTALIWDVRRSRLTPLGSGVAYPRAWHTATVLPDGTVLIAGGTGSGGQVVSEVERFDPQVGDFETLGPLGLMPRTRHTTTLMSDGTLLLVGGVSDLGFTLDTAELWDLASNASRQTGRLSGPRSSHEARLLDDGSVLVWGGEESSGNPLLHDERYDPATASFSTGVTAPTSPDPARLVASAPPDGQMDVSVNVVVSLRFSTLLNVESVHTGTAFLIGPNGLDVVSVVAAESGRLVFLTPAGPLDPGARYTVSLNGFVDRDGTALPPTAISFITEAPPSVGGSVSAPPRLGRVEGHELSAVWLPPMGSGSMNWQTNLPPSPWASLPPLQAASGATALAGQVLTLDGDPLPGVRLEIDDRLTQTDPTGQFLLTGLMAGHHELVIDGRSASRPGRTYGVFEVGVDLVDGETTTLAYTIWMPVIDTAHAVRIASPTAEEAVVTTPHIPGLEVRIPAGSVIRDHEGKPVTEVSITPIPVDRPPFPLAEGIRVPIYFTLQPGAGYVSSTSGQGARIIYPNRNTDAPGTNYQFWHYDPGDRGWYVYGQGRVTGDGRQVEPDPGVWIYEFTGAMFNSSGLNPPGTWPGNTASDGDPIDLRTGLFVSKTTDLVLEGVPSLELIRTYRTNDSASRPFGIGATHNYAIFLWSANQSAYQEVDLILPDGQRIHYTRLLPGSGYAAAVFEHSSTPTKFFKSRIAWTGTGWELVLRDGTVYEFSVDPTALSSALRGTRDRFGNRISIVRGLSRSDAITRILSSSGRWIEFVYDGGELGGRIIRANDSSGRTVNYTYDSSGRVWKVANPSGGITEYSYDTVHRMITLKDPRGIVFLTNRYDRNGRVDRQTQADAGIYQFSYTTDRTTGLVTETDITDPRGIVRRVLFNSAGFPESDTRALGRAEQQVTTSVWESGTNLLRSVTDALGRRTEYTYDANGNVLTVTRLAGTTEAARWTLTYEAPFNLVKTLTDPLQHSMAFTYEERGGLLRVNNALDQPLHFTPRSDGQIAAIRDALDNTTTFEYEQGDLVGIVDALENRETHMVDAAGRLIGITDPIGRTVRYRYDGLDRLTRVDDARGGVTELTYDGNGNVLTVRDPRGNVTTFTYDVMDRLETRQDGVLRIERYIYDSNGNVMQFTDRKGQATTFTYDGVNRTTQRRHADASTTGYVYDSGDRLRQISDSIAGTITRSYDSFDRVTSETSPQGTISYTYDAAGRRSAMTVSGDAAVTYHFDNAGQLTEITQAGSQVQMTYDSTGRRTRLTSPNSIAVEYDYDAASRVTGLTYKLGATLIGNLAYEYDGAGQRTKTTGTWARVTLPSSLGSSTYDAANHQLTFGAQTLTYDLNGSVATLSDGSDIENFTWDARGRMTAVNGPGVTGSFAYDGLGRRSSRTVNGTRREFLYDGLTPVREQDGPAVIAGLLTGLEVDEYLRRTDSGGATFILRDVLGSTLALTDATGQINTEYAYDPFGATETTGAPNGNSFQYTGRENDETGLYYYRARYYDPVRQRFISEDPIGFYGEDLNLYAYARNSPTNLTDPSGLCPACIAIPVGTKVGGAAVAAATAAIGAVTGAVGGIMLGDWLISLARQENEFTREARARFPTRAEQCAWLDRMYQKARRAGDTAKAEKIKTAQKYLGCRRSTHGR